MFSDADSLVVTRIKRNATADGEIQSIGKRMKHTFWKILKTYRKWCFLILSVYVPLCYWGPVKHICVKNYAIIDPDNDLSVRCQVIIWLISGLLSAGRESALKFESNKGTIIWYLYLKYCKRFKQYNVLANRSIDEYWISYTAILR